VLSPADYGVELREVCFRYSSSQPLLFDRLSLPIPPGAKIGLVGRSGGGKTTLTRLLLRFSDIESGAILIGGQSVRQHAGRLKKHIGYLTEHNPLYEDMPVMDYLQFCAALQGVAKDDIPARVHSMIRQCSLDAEKHKKIGELSKGYRQRVGLAQAMIHDPEVLILDEPTTGLDPNQIIEIRRLIRELGKEKTVILSTHILPEVEATCDRILIINKGRIVADGTAESLRRQAAGQEIFLVRIEDAPDDQVLQALPAIPGVTNVSGPDTATGRWEIQAVPGSPARRGLFHLCVEKHWVLTELIPVETRLEDIFRNLTLN